MRAAAVLWTTYYFTYDVHCVLIWSGVLLILCTHTHMYETIHGIIVRAFISSMQAERGLFYENVVR